MHGPILCLFVSVSILFLASPVAHAATDTVTLNSGEVVSGRIVSETDSNVDVEVSNERHTIFHTRTIARSDIKEVHKITPEQRQQEEAYEALHQYELNPDHELSSARYAEGLAAFDRFLAAYPNSEYAAQVTRERTDWQFENSELAQGRVKFAGKWMTPEERQPLLDQLQRQQLELALQTQVKSVLAARARVDAAHKEHDFLHSEAGYKGKVLPQPEYDQVMARYHANDEELANAPLALNEAVAKFNRLNDAYHKTGGTVDFQAQLDAK